MKDNQRMEEWRNYLFGNNIVMFNYKWYIANGYPAPGISKHGLTVFSCFACGGGSTMGYKLAGYDVLGCNEIDPKMNKCYTTNHKPLLNYLEDIRDFKKRKDLPKELYDLDILDGSPPCSSFSMAGNREDDRGKEKVFREGQKMQTLDDLFFDFIDVARELQPKVVVAENVKGLLIGEAWSYVHKIYQQFSDAGYYVDHFLLDASKMGVPQARERVFFIAVRKDLRSMLKQKGLFDMGPNIQFDFKCNNITYGDIEDKTKEHEDGKHIPEGILPYREKILPGRTCSDVHPKGHYFQEYKLDPAKPLPTLRAGSNCYYHYCNPRRLFDSEIILGQTFPQDYDFCGMQPIYVCGMSVPPVMMAQIAHQIKLQLFGKYYAK